jgi:hypothetical protein
MVLVPAACIAQDTSFATGPQYLMNSGSALFAHSIATPSLSLQGPPLEEGASNATADLLAGADSETSAVLPGPEPPADLLPLYYGVPRVDVTEASAREPLSEPFLGIAIPESTLDVGVWQMTSAKELHERGIGETSQEAAVESKARTRGAPRLYTNQDIDRLRQGS